MDTWYKTKVNIDSKLGGSTVTINTCDVELHEEILSVLEEIRDRRNRNGIGNDIEHMLASGKAYIQGINPDDHDFAVLAGWDIEDWAVVLRRSHSKLLVTQKLINDFRATYSRDDLRKNV